MTLGDSFGLRQIEPSVGKCPAGKFPRLGHAATAAYQQIHELTLNPARTVDGNFDHVLACERAGCTKHSRQRGIEWFSAAVRVYDVAEMRRVALYSR